MKKGYFAGELAKLLATSLEGNPDLFITGVSTLDKASPGDLAFMFEEKYHRFLSSTKALCLLVNKPFPNHNQFTYLISEKPKDTMAKVLNLFSVLPGYFNGTHPLAFVSENAGVSENASINAFSYIADNAEVQENTIIYPSCYIGDNSVIGRNCLLYPNVTVMPGTVIGNNVIIHSGTVIGSDGYGFIQTEGNNHYKVPQVGNVIIEDDVEIGSNVSVDRATIGSTIIRKGSKIDNQVHIAHNVEIGERTLIVAQSGIAGSTRIGADSILAGQSGVAGHLELGAKTLVLGKSGVTKSFPAGSKLSGFPAREHKEEIKSKAMQKKVPLLEEKVKTLEERLKYLESVLKSKS